MLADSHENRTSGDAPLVLAEGVRIYAIGDVHGRFDLLLELYEAVGADRAARPVERAIEIFLGDYVDRGPQSKEVVDWLMAGTSTGEERICLMGNHEDMLLRFLDDPLMLPLWAQNGGDATLRSFGISLPRVATTAMLEDIRADFLARLGAPRRAFLSTLPRSASVDGYFFAHAGVRPGVPLDAQVDDDLLWIREPFLSSDADFGKCVVHGHTPSAAPEVRRNRINIDTGAVFGGRLTCLVLEGAERRFLQTHREWE